MATVPIAGYIDVASTANSSTRPFTLPQGILDGSVAVVEVGWGLNNTSTANLPGWTLVDGPYAISTTHMSALYRKDVNAVDSGSTHTVTFSSGCASAVGGLVAKGTVDTVSAHTADTGSVTSSSVSGFTPGTADVLAVSLIAARHAASVATGGTAATGWTRRASAVSTPATAGQIENAVDTKQLSGQSGVAQPASTVTWNGNTVASKWVVTIAPPVGPTAIINYTTTGLSLTVDGSASTAVSPATISSYDWNWGDGTTHGSGSGASHTYATNGTYTLTLTVTDSAGRTASSTQQVSVSSGIAGPVYVVGYIDDASDTALNTFKFALPDDISDGSVAAVVLTWVNGPTVTATVPGWTLVDGPYNAANVISSALYKRDVNSADSLAETTVTFSSGSRATASGLVVLGIMDSGYVRGADTTAVATSQTPTFTPPGADRLIASLIGAHHSANVNPGAGPLGTTYDRHVDSQTSPITSGQAEGLVDTKQLSGQNGVAQPAETINWVGTARTSKWIVTFQASTNPSPLSANAGPDQSAVDPYDTVVLDGSGSKGAITGYTWTQTAGPAVSLTNGGTSNPSFRAPATLNGTTVTLALAVTNGTDTSAADTVTVTVLPHTIFRLTSNGPVPLEMRRL